MQSRKNETGYQRTHSHTNQCVTKRAMYRSFACVMCEQLQNSRAHRNPKSHRQLLINRHQTRAAAVLSVAQIGNRNAVHAAKLNGIARAQQKELRN